MSSFSQLLDSVNPNRVPSQSPANALPRPKPAGAPLSTGNLSSSKELSTNFAAGIKRKAESAPVESASKIIRKDAHISSGPRSAAGTNSPANATNNPRPPPSAKPATPAAAPKPATPVAAPKPAPNSYAAMMARAKEAAASAPKQVADKIQHKPTEKLSQRQQIERAKALKEARLAAKKGKPIPQRSLSSTAAGKSGAAKSTTIVVKTNGVKGKPEKPEKPEKPKKVRADLGYSGTARPNPAAQPPRSAQSSARQQAPAKSAVNKSSDRYRYAYSDEDEEDEDDDEDDSEMEAGGGFDALMAEEEVSLRAARKEDAAAHAEEEAHRREKMERKRKLMALAAKKR